MGHVRVERRGRLWPVLAAAIVALLTGSTAPWWWDQVSASSGTDTADVPLSEVITPLQPSRQPTTQQPTTQGPTGAASSRCWIITAPLTQLRREMHPVATGRTIPVARYPVLEEVDQPWAGSTIHWFHITANGRTGWVQDNPTEVGNRADACS